MADTSHTKVLPNVVPPRKGLWHMADAASYSVGGFKRLMAETAARQELAGGVAGAAIFAWAGVSAAHWLGFVVLFCILLAVEALNTAIEVITNHLSPDWSVMAKNAKDLGSLAVGLILIANLAYFGAVLAGLI